MDGGRAWWLLALTSALASGCKDDASSRRRRDAQVTGTPRPQSELNVRIEGKPVAMQSALAWRQPDDTIDVIVSSVARSCASGSGPFGDVFPDEESFTLTIARQLERSGGLVPRIQALGYNDDYARPKRSRVKLTGDGTPEQGLTVITRLEAPGMGVGPASKTIEIEGKIDALGCPMTTGAAGAPARPPAQEGTLEVAGQRLPIAGAMIDSGRFSGERMIVLSNADLTCGELWHDGGADLVVELVYRDDGDELAYASLDGAWIDFDQPSQPPDPSRDASPGGLVATPTRAPAGSTTVVLALSGAADVMGYPVALDGEVTAQVCPAKTK